MGLKGNYQSPAQSKQILLKSMRILGMRELLNQAFIRPDRRDKQLLAFVGK